MKVLGVLLVVVGAILLAVAAWINSRQKTFYATALLRADGQVINLIPRRSGRSGPTWTPEVEFTDTAGRVVHFVSRISTKPAGYHVGQIVRVAYPSGDPARADVDSISERWGMVMIPGAMGGIFALIGTIFLVAGRPPGGD
jgi:hypothetical protein